MIAHLNGTLSFIGENYVVIDVSGVGYKVYVSINTSNLLTLDSSVKLFVYTHFSNDEINLFGFKDKNEEDIFVKLISISGVGPKASLAILSVLNPTEIIMAIISSDVKALKKAVGIGDKVAKRIILELKDKFSTDDVFAVDDEFSEIENNNGGSSNIQSEVVTALVALGYGQSEAGKAVREVFAGLKDDELSNFTVEKMLSLALKKLSIF